MTVSPVVEAPHVVLLTKAPFYKEMDGGSKRVAAIARELRIAGADLRAYSVRGELPHRDAAVVGSVGVTFSDRLAALRVLAASLSTMSASVMKWFSWRVALEIARDVRANSKLTRLIEHSQLAPYVVLARPEQRTVLDTHNVESELLANFASSTGSALMRAVARYESWAMRRVERRALDRFDAVVAVSSHDASELESMSRGAVRVSVASNGTGDAWFQALSSPAEEPTVVFAAHLGWRPNVDAAVWLVDKVWPEVLRIRPDARLILAGRSPAAEVLALRSSTVSVLADVDDMVPVVARAWVATAPLLAAGGTRLKIIEAIAAGTPVVSTALGALGLEEMAGESLIIANTPSEFAVALTRLFRDRPNHEQTRFLAKNYRWSRTLASLIDSVLREPSYEVDGRV